jgi:hypothetical protein
MKLYEVPKNTDIVVPAFPDGASGTIGPWYLHFHHVDGMYSYCTDPAANNEVVHLAAWTEVELAT